MLRRAQLATLPLLPPQQPEALRCGKLSAGPTEVSPTNRCTIRSFCHNWVVSIGALLSLSAANFPQMLKPLGLTMRQTID